MQHLHTHHAAIGVVDVSVFTVHSLHNYCECTTKCNAMTPFQERLSESVCHYIHIWIIMASCSCLLWPAYHPSLSVAAESGYEHFCLLMWSDNTSCERVLIYTLSVRAWGCVQTIVESQCSAFLWPKASLSAAYWSWFRPRVGLWGVWQHSAAISLTQQQLQGLSLCRTAAFLCWDEPVEVVFAPFKDVPPHWKCSIHDQLVQGPEKEDEEDSGEQEWELEVFSEKLRNLTIKND